MNYIILDTEYTTWPGALESGWSLPGQHREIVQIAAISVDQFFHPIDDLDVIVRPKLNPVLSDLFVELTQITQDRVDQAPGFPVGLTALMEFIGDLPVIVMNADEAVFRENCRINDLDFTLPSFHRLRPFLEACGVDLRGRSSGDLHALTDEPLKGHTHNALHDVRSMAAWLRFAQRQGWFTQLDQLPTGAPDVDPRSNPQ
jgi:inhibitor of KinA sporulation pathway (predicted exonuclease)